MFNKITTIGLIVLIVYITNGKQHIVMAFLGVADDQYPAKWLIVNKNKTKKQTYFYRFETALSIRCYQCSTQTDPKGVDSCGAYKRFNASQHIAIECNSDESHMPGSFCKKVVQQGPRGFICE